MVGWKVLSGMKALRNGKKLPFGGLEEQVSQSPAGRHQRQSYCAGRVNIYWRVSEHANYNNGDTGGGGGSSTTTKTHPSAMSAYNNSIRNRSLLTRRGGVARRLRLIHENGLC